MGNQTHGTTVAAPFVSGGKPLTSHGSSTEIGRGDRDAPNLTKPEIEMNAPHGTLSSKDATRIQDEIRGLEIGPAPKRDIVLQRVRAARKRLAPIPSAVPRLR